MDYDGRLSVAYEEARGLRPEGEDAWREALRDEVQPGDVVADIGAGTGRFARRLAALFAAQVVAIEPSHGMRTNRGGPPTASVAWVAGRAEALPVRTAIVDVAWLAYVVHYTDLNGAGSEVGRILKADGRALVWSSFPDRIDEVAWMRWFPSAPEIDRARLPTVADVEAAWKGSGLLLRRRRLVHVMTATNLTELADRISKRGISTLELIGDAEFSEGLAAMRRDAARGANDSPVFTPVDLLTFEREG